MPGKTNSRNWNDVRTAIVTVGVVSTLGLWNLFAQPSKAAPVTAKETTTPPPSEPPVALEPTAMPKIKIMFTQVVPQTFVDAQPQPGKNKNNHNNNNSNNNNGGGPVTQTRSS